MVPPAVARVPSGTPRRADRSAIRRNNLAVVTRHLVPPLFRWGTARSFRSELQADAAKRSRRTGN